VGHSLNEDSGCYAPSYLGRLLAPSALASAGGTDRDLAATQFTRNYVANNIIEFKHFKIKNFINFYDVYIFK
jgi:hypothetical protein